jgi:hypothetical protein
MVGAVHPESVMRWLSAGLALLLRASAAPAQPPQPPACCVVSGIVAAPSGLQAPHAEVRLRDSSAAIVAATITNTNGEFRLENVHPGEYVLNVARDGFAPIDNRIRVRSNLTSLRSVLALAEQSSSVVVTGTAPGVALAPEENRSGGLGSSGKTTFLLTAERQEEKEQAIVYARTPPGQRRVVVRDAFTGGSAQQHVTERRNALELSYTVAVSRGKHSLRTGFLIPKIDCRRVDDRSNFTGTYTFVSLENYAAGVPLSFTQNIGNGLRYRTGTDQPVAATVSAHAFNLLNQVNFTRIVGNESSPFFQSPLAAASARRLQFSLRLSF